MRAVTVSIVHADPLRAGRDEAAELLSELGSVPEQVLLVVSSRLDPNTNATSEPQTNAAIAHSAARTLESWFDPTAYDGPVLNFPRSFAPLPPS
jgi:hypothetical protein